MRSDGFGDVTDRDQPELDWEESQVDHDHDHDDEQPTTELDRAHLQRALAKTGAATSGHVGVSRHDSGLGPAARGATGFGRAAVSEFDELDAVMQGDAAQSGRYEAARLDELGDALRTGLARSGSLDQLGEALRVGSERGVSSLLDELGEAILAEGYPEDEESAPLDELGQVLRADASRAGRLDELGAARRVSYEPSRRLDELGAAMRGSAGKDAGRTSYEPSARLDELDAEMRGSSGKDAGRTSYEPSGRLSAVGAPKRAEAPHVVYESPIEDLSRARAEDASARLDELGAAMLAVTGLSAPTVALDQLGVALSSPPTPPKVTPPKVTPPKVTPPRPIGGGSRRQTQTPPAPSSSSPSARSGQRAAPGSTGSPITSARISFTPSRPSSPSTLPAGITGAFAPAASSSRSTSASSVMQGNTATATARVPLPAPPAAAGVAPKRRRGDESREFVRERRDTPPISAPETRSALQGLSKPAARLPSRPPPLPAGRKALVAEPDEGSPLIDLTAAALPINVPSTPPALPLQRNVVPLSAASRVTASATATGQLKPVTSTGPFKAVTIDVPPAAGDGDMDVVAPEPSAFVHGDSRTLEVEVVETTEGGLVTRTASVFARVRSLRADWDTSVWRESFTRARAFVSAQLPRTTKRRVWILAGVLTIVLSAACTAAFLLTRTPEASAAVETGPTEAEIQRIMISRTGFMISSYPSGARIYVDGRETGRFTPERVTGLTPGLHSIEIKLAGYYDTNLPAVLEEGSTLVMPPVDLRPLPSTDSDVSEP